MTDQLSPEQPKGKLDYQPPSKDLFLHQRQQPSLGFGMELGLTWGELRVPSPAQDRRRLLVPGVQIVRKGAKNRATARRTASEKKGGKMDGLHSLSPSSSRLFPLSERLGQARRRCRWLFTWS